MYISIYLYNTYIFIERERDRETERQRDRETKRQRDRETERQRDRETERQRDRETERESKYIYIYIYICTYMIAGIHIIIVSASIIVSRISTCVESYSFMLR